MLNNINNKYFTNLSTYQYKKAIADTHIKENADILTQMNKIQINKLKEIGIKPSKVPSQLLTNNTSNQIKPKEIDKYSNLGQFIYMGKCMEDQVPSGSFLTSPTNLTNISKRVFLLNDGRLVIDHDFGDNFPLQKVKIKKEGKNLVNLQNNTKGKKGFVFILDLTFSHQNNKYLNNHTMNKRIFNNRNNKIILKSMTNEQMNKLKESNIDLTRIPDQSADHNSVFTNRSEKPYIYMGKLDESETTLKRGIDINVLAGNNLTLTKIDRMVFLKPNGDFVINKIIPGKWFQIGYNDIDQTAKLIYENDEPKKNNDDFIFELDVMYPAKKKAEGGRKSKKPTTKPVKKPTTKPNTKPVKKPITKPVVKKTVKKPITKPVKKPVKKSTKKPKKTKSLTNQFMNLFK